MPTPQEAVAHADRLYGEARQRVSDHLKATGEIHSEHLKAMGDAGVAAAKIRAAVAHIDTPPDVIARGHAMREGFAHKVAHTVLGGANAKGYSRYYPLSDEQFTQLQETGSWEGNPRPHPLDA